ncbi:fumarylacetoacetate hydrolase family protein [Sulfitobacter pseudonitzschiae]|uniref:2-keto-4-pentenoate hydratase n=2 Tax=Roseobacteraceae TaxID=2854170 RepID=A0A975WDX0_9RHOB|nr:MULTISPECIES: fumarylacetoacetate hydrolase family protein [Roseobacteraceae]MBM1817645.1 fumarylacetoacetate hydrolase family protein [Pseudosulfitobacter pseudonitzschiae]MBM1834640.1 fumarylacetoacetate hydrolase family protein [Pseudosulfitobacter pseudonitzschiae]MBM1839504.1 fumarylacetoacetate hydrolase family protein [Pseudosulfitobacter pseudonitzschiae]MBM1844355.1 fumarylacetoacetate hydrolase family protein [Pseudosulfitobacter pseudonitzschiae]MBM1849189.1 fumarylacetoacetate h|tara:strand:+ start:5241 stop:6029 length:789 start_codon:yes stop_codon:yes gene_type:complete
MTKDDGHTIAADALWQAQRDAVPCGPIHTHLNAGGINAAYAVQQINIERSLAQGGRVIGHKIGLTAKAVQAQMGVDQPDYGTLLSNMIIGDGGTIAADRVLQPKIEAEIAFIMGEDLDIAQPNAADVLRATAFIAPAIEIVDSRIADWKITLLDTIADNASSGLLVLGSPAISPLGFDFTGCEMDMTLNGQSVSTGTGAACMGSPVTAVAWLAEKMRDNGTPIRAGQIILSGALGPMAPVSGKATVEASIGGLGHVSVSFAE